MSDFNDAIRAAAGRNEIRFDAQGRLVRTEAVESRAGDQSEQRHTEGSSDAGEGLDVDPPGPRNESESLNDAIRNAAKGY